MVIFTQARSGTTFLEELDAPLMDMVAASFEESWNTNPVAALVRERELRDAMEGRVISGGRSISMGLATPTAPEVREPPDSPIISAENARKRVTDAGLDLVIPDAGIPERALQILMDRKRAERMRQDAYTRGPTGWEAGSLRVAVVLGASLLDPLNVASAFIPVVGPARYAAALARVGGAGRQVGAGFLQGALQSARYVVGRGVVRAGVGATEGIVGAALLEPIVLNAMRYEQADYDLIDSLLNVALGGALGGGLHVVGGGVLDATARFAIRRRTVLARELLRARPGSRMDETAVASDPSLGAAFGAFRASPGYRIHLSDALTEAAPETREALLRTAVAQTGQGESVRVESLANVDPGYAAAMAGRPPAGSAAPSPVRAGTPTFLRLSPEEQIRELDYAGAHDRGLVSTIESLAAVAGSSRTDIARQMQDMGIEVDAAIVRAVYQKLGIPLDDGPELSAWREARRGRPDALRRQRAAERAQPVPAAAMQAVARDAAGDRLSTLADSAAALEADLRASRPVDDGSPDVAERRATEALDELRQLTAALDKPKVLEDLLSETAAIDVEAGALSRAAMAMAMCELRRGFA